MHPQPWIILAASLLGNCGFWLFCFNRINATGLARRKIKIIEKAFIVLCFLIPLIIALAEWSALTEWLLRGTDWWPQSAPIFSLYGAWCLASGIVLGVIWLESRRLIIPPPHQVKVENESFHVHQLLENGSPRDNLTKFLNKLPGNQIGHLQVTRKTLRLPRQIDGAQGLKIGHISDLHFTGQYHLEHYQFVVDRFMDSEPDLIVISGDIIDYARCLPWIPEVLGRMHAPLGCYFVLGNHDRRLTDIEALTKSITDLGHIDLGKSNHCVPLPGGGNLQLLGNELPWFERHATPTTRYGTEADQSSPPLPRSCAMRLGVSHSPDQLRWARRNRVDLLLAGHTHGGQVRIPGLGPIVAPSFYGTRYASGVFFHSPTLMHVSRGVAGTHPLRWRCKPEVSLLTLTN